jgi:hypothetical protein
VKPLPVALLTGAAVAVAVVDPHEELVDRYLAEAERAGARLDSVAISQDADRRSVELVLELPSDLDPARIVAAIADVEGVLEVRWED